MADLADFEILVNAVQEVFADPSVEFALFDGQAERRVVWIPTKFKNDGPVGFSKNNDVLWQELLVVEAHHHGLDFFDCANIRNRVANAIHRVFGAESVPHDGFYSTDPDADKDTPPATTWTSSSVIVQRYVWKMNVPRIEETSYPVAVSQIDIVDGTQFTTTDDSALTLTEQLEIKP